MHLRIVSSISRKKLRETRENPEILETLEILQQNAELSQKKHAKANTWHQDQSAEWSGDHIQRKPFTGRGSG